MRAALRVSGLAGLTGLAGVVSSVVADRLLPMPHEDPLRSTLVHVPALIAAVLGIEAWMRTRGLEPLGNRERRSLAGLSVVVLVGALTWRSLGTVIADWLVFAAFLLVLGYWLARTIVRLRPLLGERLEGRPSAIFFWLPLVLYLVITPWSTEHRPPDGDEPFNLLLGVGVKDERDGFSHCFSNSCPHSGHRSFDARRSYPHLMHSPSFLRLRRSGIRMKLIEPIANARAGIHNGSLRPHSCQEGT